MSRKHLSTDQEVGNRGMQKTKNDIWPSKEVCRKLKFGVPVAFIPTPSVDKYVMEHYGVTLISPPNRVETPRWPLIRHSHKTVVIPTAPPAGSIPCEDGFPDEGIEADMPLK